ncbi:MAG: hypothetical protein ABMB14_28320 [Myxococcota bacterium]
MTVRLASWTIALAMGAAACGEEAAPGGNRDPRLADPVGSWHVDRVILTGEDGAGAYTSTQTLPYGTGTTAEFMDLAFHDDGVLLVDQQGYTSELAWEATGPDTVEVLGDFDWDRWTCELPASDPDAMTCVLADPDAEATLEISRD